MGDTTTRFSTVSWRSFNGWNKADMGFLLQGFDRQRSKPAKQDTPGALLKKYMNALLHQSANHHRTRGRNERLMTHAGSMANTNTAAIIMKPS